MKLYLKKLDCNGVAYIQDRFNEQKPIGGAHENDFKYMKLCLKNLGNNDVIYIQNEFNGEELPMVNYALPYEINKYDVLCGTVVSTNKSGIEIILDNGEDADMKQLYAFAFCGGTIGQRVIVSIRSYDTKRDNFKVSVDSFSMSAT